MYACFLLLVLVLRARRPACDEPIRSAASHGLPPSYDALACTLLPTLARQISELRKHVVILQSRAATIDTLKAEIIRLESELLEQQNRVKGLSRPLHGHKWPPPPPNPSPLHITSTRQHAASSAGVPGSYCCPFPRLPACDAHNARWSACGPTACF